MRFSPFRAIASTLLLLLLAACASDGPSGIAPEAGISTTTLNGTQLALVSGGGQAGVPGQALAEPVVVRVTNRKGAPVVNGLLNFIPPRGGGVEPRQARTDAQGYARTTWTLGSLGAQALRVSGAGGTLVVTATAQPGTGTRIGLVKTAGDGQQAAAGTLLRGSLQVAVMRDDGTPVSGAVVTWTPSAGTLDRTSSRASGVGLTAVRWTLGAEGGTQTLTASAPGAEPVTFTATATGGLPRAATLQVLPDSIVLDAGATAALTAVIRDSAGAVLPGRALVWSSSNAAVASVDSLGVVRGVAGGTAQVTARLGALTASATVRVRPGPASIQVQPDSLVLDVDGTGHLTAVVRDGSGAVHPGPAPAWSSADPTVATVDANGNVRGVAPGTVRVTATLGALSAGATVRVRGRGPSLELFPDSLVLDIGVWGKLYPVVRDASGRATVDYRVEYTTSADRV
ncbi:MAG TPA: Ig-like domain-containing protein, partial [Longimicrobium sp.]|nr:Ig-like domain-containing protein [Longimicrobium sp.]